MPRSRLWFPIREIYDTRLDTAAAIYLIDSVVATAHEARESHRKDLLWTESLKLYPIEWKYFCKCLISFEPYSVTYWSVRFCTTTMASSAREVGVDWERPGMGSSALFVTCRVRRQVECVRKAVCASARFRRQPTKGSLCRRFRFHWNRTDDFYWQRERGTGKPKRGTIVKVDWNEI